MVQTVSPHALRLRCRQVVLHQSATRGTMRDATAIIGDVDLLAPLVGLVERLRAEVTKLQERWEELNEDLEDKKRRLRLAEATVELMHRRQEEGPAGDGAPRAEGTGDVLQAAQASLERKPEDAFER
jgi:hypothetical protein